MLFTRYARGMVYWCDIPKYETNPNIQQGNRPVIIVSNNMGNCLSNNVTVVPCTTSIDKNPKQPTHYVLPMSIKDGTQSLVLCENIITINKDLLRGFMGILDDDTMKEIDKCLLATLGLIDVRNVFDDKPVKKEPEIKPLKKEQPKIKPVHRIQGRRIQGLDQMKEFLDYYNKYGVDKTMEEYGIPTKAATYQRVNWYKAKFK